MDWFREFCAFLASLLQEWGALLTGGIPSAVIVVWGYVSGKPMIRVFGLVFLGLTFLLSLFLSWRKQWREAEKNFVQISPAALMELREGKTSPHANAVLKPYLHKRIKFAATFSDISYVMSGLMIVHLRSGDVSVHAFIPFWRDRQFSPLPKGEGITVTGTLTEINQLGIKIAGIEVVPNPLVVKVPILKELEV